MLTCDTLYEQLIHAHPMERQHFERDLAIATAELCAMYGKKYVLEKSASPGAIPTKEEYFPALCSAILFLERKEETDRKCFLQRAESAFLSVWKEKAKAVKEE